MSNFRYFLCTWLPEAPESSTDEIKRSKYEYSLLCLLIK